MYLYFALYLLGSAASRVAVTVAQQRVACDFCCYRGAGPREIKYFLSDILITDRAQQWLSPHLGKQKTWTRDVSSVRLIDNVEHLRHFTIVKLESWTNNENENFIIAQMNQRTNSTHNKSKDFKRKYLTIYFAICIISISIFPQSSWKPEAYWSITSETRQIRILGRPNINANLHASIFTCFCFLRPKQILILYFQKHSMTMLIARVHNWARRCPNLKTVSSLLLRAKTLRAFKEMVTNDYHLLVQLPYPTHYYFKTTLFAQKQCYSQWSCSQTCYI